MAGNSSQQPTKEMETLSPIKWKWSHSVMSDSVTPWTVAHKAPLSLGFSRQRYWIGLPFPSPGDLPNPGIESRSPTLQADTLPSEPLGKPQSNKPQGNEFHQQWCELRRGSFSIWDLRWGCSPSRHSGWSFRWDTKTEISVKQCPESQPTDTGIIYIYAI